VSTLHGVRSAALKGAKNTCEGFRFDETSKTLSIRGVAKKISKLERLTAGSSGRWCTARIPFDIAAAALQHTLWGDDGLHIGVAVLDEEVMPSGKMLCPRLMRKAARPQPSPFLSDDVLAMRYEELVLISRKSGEGDHAYTRIGISMLETATRWFEHMPARPCDIR
jgi:hypothetical protein